MQLKRDNIMIWNLIGPIICKYYQTVEKSMIKFTQADQNAKRMASIEKTMFILVLDMSGSMKGQRWSDVTTETKRFLQLIKSDSLMSKHSKVSIITYDSKAIINFENQNADPQLVDQLEFRGHGTDFNMPLMNVLKISKKYLEHFDIF